MFDTIKYNCPHCHNERSEQTYIDGLLNTYNLDNLPIEAALSFNNYLITCNHCNKKSRIILTNITASCIVIKGE